MAIVARNAAHQTARQLPDRRSLRCCFSPRRLRLSASFGRGLLILVSAHHGHQLSHSLWGDHSIQEPITVNFSQKAIDLLTPSDLYDEPCLCGMSVGRGHDKELAPNLGSLDRQMASVPCGAVDLVRDRRRMRLIRLTSAGFALGEPALRLAVASNSTSTADLYSEYIADW